MIKYIIFLEGIEKKVESYLIDRGYSVANITEYINNTFNYKGKGILYRVINNKIWLYSEFFRMEVVEAEEKDALKAIYIEQIKNYETALNYGELMPPEVRFLNRSEAYVISKGDSTQAIENVKDRYNDTYNDVMDFNNYKDSLNIQFKISDIEQLMAEKEKQKSTVLFHKVTIDYFNEYLTFTIENTSYFYRKGEGLSISIIRKENTTHENKYGVSVPVLLEVGDIEVYDFASNKLTVRTNHTIMKKIEETGGIKGSLWISDAGAQAKIKNENFALQQLYAQRSANKRLRKILNNVNSAKDSSKNIETLDMEAFTPNIQELNLNQRQSIFGSLNAEDLFLIQGPPGTGKTTVICEMINYLTKKGNKVLLSAQTHLAVDNVLQKIGEEPHIEAIRIGNDEKFELGSKKYMLENRIVNLQEEIRNSYENKKNAVENIRESVSRKQTDEPSYLFIKKHGKDLIELISMYKSEKKKYKNLSEEILILEQDITALQLEIKADYEMYAKKKTSIDQVRQALKTEFSSIELVTFANVQKIVSLSKEKIRQFSNFRKLAFQYQTGHNATLAPNKQINKIESRRLELQSILKVYKSKKYKEMKYRDVFGKIDWNQDFTKEESELRELERQLTSITSQKVINEKRLKKEEEILISIQTDLFRFARQHEKLINDFLRVELDITSLSGLKPFLILMEEYVNFIEKGLRLPDETQQIINDLSRYDKVETVLNLVGSINERLLTARESLTLNEQKFEVIQNQYDDYQKHDSLSHYLLLTNKILDDLSEYDLQKTEDFLVNLEKEKKKLELFDNSSGIQAEWASRMEVYQESFEEYYLKVANLICATCLGIAQRSDNAFSETEFDYLIVDEAGRATVKELLVPMVRGKKIILVGDHKQISPELEKTIQDKLLASGEAADDVLALKQSLFGKLYENTSEYNKIMLNKQYRMSEGIASIVSKHFYDDELMNGENIAKIEHGLESVLTQSSYWINTPENDSHYMEQRERNSYYNTGEILATENLLKWLDRHLSENKSVGLIAPYKPHKEKMEAMVLSNIWEHLEIEVNTIDAFQGREKQIVIMNMVRNNNKRRSGFLKEMSRINVGLSRAQELMFIVGSVSFVRSLMTHNIEEFRLSTLNNIVKELQKRQAILPTNYFVKGMPS